MQARIMGTKTSAAEGELLGIETGLFGASRGDAEPPKSGLAARSAPMRLIAQGRLEVRAAPDVVLNGVSLELSRLHSRILAALLESPDPLSTSQLATIVWQGRFVSEHTVHSQIALLRARLLDFHLRIKNVRGRGYILE